MMRILKKIVAMIGAVLLLLGTAVAQDKAPSLTYQLLEPADKRIYALGDTGYFVENLKSFVGTPERLERINVYAECYNKNFALAGDVKKYLYLVESSRCTEITEDLTGENPVFTRIREAYDVTASDSLALDHYSQYLDWFYRTDHHWNYKGSYQGYCDLIDMMFGPEEEKIEPIETVEFSDVIFNGSYSKRVSKVLSAEPFTVYRFPEFVPYRAVIDGKPTRKYGNADQYFKGKYSKAKLANHYALFYGGDNGEVILKTNRPEKKTLLIVSNSLANAVKLLLLQHYDAIYVVDPRHYYKEKRAKFNAKSYIQKYEIDEVLFMGDATFFLTDPMTSLVSQPR